MPPFKLDPNAWLDNADIAHFVYDLIEHNIHQSLTPQIPRPPLTPTQSPPSLFKALCGAQLIFPTS